MNNLFDAPDIYSLHLDSGQIVLGQFKFETDTVVAIDFPFVVTTEQTVMGPKTFLKEYMAYSMESRIKLNKSHIITVSPCDDSVKEIYIKRLASLLLDVSRQSMEKNCPIEHLHYSMTYH